MADITAGAVAEPFSFSRVVGRIAQVIGARWAALLVLAILFGALPDAFGHWAQLGFWRWGPEVMPQATNHFMMFGIALGIVEYVAFTLVSSVMIGAGALITMGELHGERLSFRAALAVGLRFALRVFALTIVVSLAVAIGLVLLIVPGIFLTVMWFVATPVMVIERRGLRDALTRSADLTRGRRWVILGLYLLMIVLTVSLGFAAVALLAFLEPTWLTLWLETYALSPLAVASGLVVSVVGTTVVYDELRAEKEGAPAGDVAAVFD